MSSKFHVIVEARPTYLWHWTRLNSLNIKWEFNNLRAHLVFHTVESRLAISIRCFDVKNKFIIKKTCFNIFMEFTRVHKGSQTHKNTTRTKSAQRRDFSRVNWFLQRNILINDVSPDSHVHNHNGRYLLFNHLWMRNYYENIYNIFLHSL